MDGLKIHLNEVEWILIRPSNTQPAINLSIEGKDSRRLQLLEDKFTKILADIKEAVLKE